jgi:hypothetical protein
MGYAADNPNTRSSLPSKFDFSLGHGKQCGRINLRTMDHTRSVTAADRAAALPKGPFRNSALATVATSGRS